jgi:hypothetical protein
VSKEQRNEVRDNQSKERSKALRNCTTINIISAIFVFVMDAFDVISVMFT